jgi:hypothetical protein
MIPCLFPIRVVACVFDPKQDNKTVDKVEQGSESASTHGWSWTPPKLDDIGEGRVLGSAWPDLHKRVAPPPLGTVVGAGKPAVCLNWGPPPAWGTPLVPFPGSDKLPEGDARLLPRLPDRWLVVRILRRTHDAGGWADLAPTTAAWVIDAGVESSDPASPLLRVKADDDDNDTPSWKRIGRWRRLPDPTTSDKAIASDEQLAASYRIHLQGSDHAPDLTFPAYAPSCLNNLAFIDTLDDVSEDVLARSALSYVVMGFYRDPERHDPLQLLRKQAKPLSDAALRRRLGLADAFLAELREAKKDLHAHVRNAIAEVRHHLIVADGSPVELQGRWASDDDLRAQLRQLVADMKADGHDEDAIEDALGFDPEMPFEVTPLGDRSLFSGMVTYIDYWNPKSYMGPAFGSPEAERVHAGGTFYNQPAVVGCGATAEEAMAAILSGITPKDDPQWSLSPTFFRLLKAMLNNQLAAWDAVGGKDLERHADRLSTFVQVPRGVEWAVRPKGKAGNEGRETPRLDEKLRGLHHALAEAQLAVDRQQWERDGAAETLYTAWWLIAPGADAKKDAVIRRFLNAYAKSIGTMDRQLAKLAGLRDTCAGSLVSALGADLELKRVEAPAFLMPKEPAVALRFVGERLPERAPAPIGRSAGQVASGRSATPKALLPADVARALTGWNEKDQPLREALAALAGEAAVVEEAVAALMQSESSSALDEIEPWVKRQGLLFDRLGGSAIAPISHPRGKTVGNTLATKDGRQIPLGDLCAAWTRQPWSPIFLDWEVLWIDEGKEAKEGRPLRGRTLLINRPQNQIASRLGALRGAKGATVLTALESCRYNLESAARADILAQTLSGLHQQLLQRDDALPRITPSPTDPEDGPLAPLVERTRLGPPNAGATTPLDGLRRGTMRILRLWVVDRFGQAYKLTKPEVFTASGTRKQDEVAFERRLLEPACLSVDFAFPEVTSTPEQPRCAPGPVRGYLLPSQIDRAMVAYDAAGAPLGLVVRSSDSETTWRPLRAAAPAGAGVDPVLADFLAPLVGKQQAVEHFDALIAQVDAALARTLPPGMLDRTSTASILGRPLALVPADVGIARRGGPIADPQWFTRAGADAPYTVENGDPEQVRSALDEVAAARRAPGVEVAVRVGSRALPDDGVIGWYEGGFTGALRRGAKLDTDPARATGDTFTLRAPGAREAPPTRVTFLLDPHGKIYLEPVRPVLKDGKETFRPDLLPVRVLGLLPEWYEDELRRLQAVVRVAPVLLPSHAVLREITAGGTLAPDKAAVRLPVPAVSLGRTATPVSGDVVAELSLDLGSARPSVPVGAVSGAASVPLVDVAAIEGLIVF